MITLVSDVMVLWLVQKLDGRWNKWFQGTLSWYIWHSVPRCCGKIISDSGHHGIEWDQIRFSLLFAKQTCVRFETNTWDEAILPWISQPTVHRSNLEWPTTVTLYPGSSVDQHNHYNWPIYTVQGAHVVGNSNAESAKKHTLEIRPSQQFQITWSRYWLEMNRDFKRTKLELNLVF